MLSINGNRLIENINALGAIGKDEEGKRTRLAASDADRAGRDALVGWMQDTGLRVVVDRIGNIFGIWETPENQNEDSLMVGSHIDTVIDAGQYDGCYGVLAGLEVIKTLKEAGYMPERPITVAAFTNEEGVRYIPDMMGSLVYAGGLSVEQAHATVGIDGTILGEELRRIGYEGTTEPGFLKPHAYLELHVEQGPILDAEGIQIGAVENLQGISWQQITIEGVANHAGTTPWTLRADAGLAAAKAIVFLGDRCNLPNSKTVATVGCIEFEPNAINIIPSKAAFTVDMRNPIEDRLKEEEKAFADYLKELEQTDKVKISREHLVRFEPVLFNEGIVSLMEQVAEKRGLTSRRITSGAGHDAQMMARMCPTAMIFVPSIDGISHNPKEFTSDKDLLAGANVLLDVVTSLSGAKQ